MEIQKVDEISMSLARAVLEAKPGTPEFKNAVEANCTWIKTLSEVQKSEDEIRIKQNSADDQLVTSRDEMAMKDKQSRFKLAVDIAGVVVSLVGVCIMGWVSVTATKAELQDTPLFGTAKDVAKTSMRFLIK